MTRLLTLLAVLLLTSLACAVPVANSLPTAMPNALGAPTNTPNALATPNTPKATVVRVTISQAVVTVRKTAGGEASGEYVYSGDRVEIIKCIGDWCKIKKLVDGKTISGFIFRGCIAELADGLRCEARP